MISLFRSYKLTDVAVVESVQRHDNAVMETFYHRCHSYFQTHSGALFIEESSLDDIFQDSMIHLWREIETRRITVVDGKVCRMVQGEARPMTGSLTTFLMSVAKRKHWEMLRRSHQQQNSDIAAIDTSRYAEHQAEVSDEVLAEQIVSDTLLMMTDRCREILTLYYYEQRSLDEILAQRSENTSKEGLKTSKYKCMNRLRQMVQQKFQSYGIRYR